eukprot:4005637-Prymnesium_polylepis.1
MAFVETRQAGASLAEAGHSSRARGGARSLGPHNQQSNEGLRAQLTVASRRCSVDEADEVEQHASDDGSSDAPLRFVG